jgi:hypothetical protein
MKLNTKKLAKIITLAITSMLIATASAEVYKYLYIDGGITVGGATMAWYEGSDAPAGTSIVGTTATVDFPVEEGTPLNFTEALFLRNENATGSFYINITVTTAVSGTDFNEAKMHIFENETSTPDWTYVATIDLTDTDSFYAGSLAWHNVTRMTFEISAAVGASGTKPFDIQVEYHE